MLIWAQKGTAGTAGRQRGETIRQGDGGVGVQRIAGCLDTVVLPVCSAAPPRSQTRGCWGSVLTGRRSLCSTSAKTNCVLSLQGTERDNSVRCVLDVFRSHSRARASHFVIFVPGEKSRRRREKKRGGMPQQLQQQKLSSSPGSRSYAQITSL